MMHHIGMFWFFVPILLFWGLGYVAEQGVRRRAGRQETSSAGRRPEGDSYEVEIFRLADRLGGRVTVSDVVVTTGLTPREADLTLQAMVDGVRVQMEVTDRGAVYYIFPELTHTASDPLPVSPREE